MKRTITITMTVAEWRAIDFAVGNTLEGVSPEDPNIFHTKNGLRTVERAAQKLTNAIREAHHG